MKKQKPYIYIFIRTDIDKTYQIIQTGHALFEHGLNIKDKPDQISSFCLLQAKDEKHLLKISQKLGMNGIDFTMFHEPDLNEFTSIAIGPIYGDERKFFKKFKLYR